MRRERQREYIKERYGEEERERSNWRMNRKRVKDENEVRNERIYKRIIA